MDSRTVIKFLPHCLYFCSLHARPILCTDFLTEEDLLYTPDFIEKSEIIFIFWTLTISYQMGTNVPFQYLLLRDQF